MAWMPRWCGSCRVRGQVAGASAPQAPPVTWAGPGQPAAPPPGLTREPGRARSWLLLVLVCSETAGTAGDTGRRLIHTMWMPRSRCCMCMVEASTPYGLVRTVPKLTGQPRMSTALMRVGWMVTLTRDWPGRSVGPQVGLVLGAELVREGVVVIGGDLGVAADLQVTVGNGQVEEKYVHGRVRPQVPRLLPGGIERGGDRLVLGEEPRPPTAGYGRPGRPYPRWRTRHRAGHGGMRESRAWLSFLHGIVGPGSAATVGGPQAPVAAIGQDGPRGRSA